MFYNIFRVAVSKYENMNQNLKNSMHTGFMVAFGYAGVIALF